MPKAFSDIRSYHHLQVQDLVQAQQIFHSDLFNRDNVVATAIGLYRRRDHKNPRTLANSTIKRSGPDPSWPCLLVFVSKWEEVGQLLRRKEGEYEVVPRYVSLPDRRRVPTCVILVEEAEQSAPPLYQRLSFPTWLMGGGFPVLRYAQEENRAGSIGCLVSDGANVFALTNRHVSGSGGETIETFIRGERQRIGVAAQQHVEKVDLDTAFPGFTVGKGWAMPVTYSNVDAGLVLIDDVHQWTAQLYGIGELGPVFDLSSDTISLDLIGSKVCAFGAASGALRGEIQGFFYRYRTVGAVGYVSDVLIGPRAGEALQTIPGDSGTLWCLDDAKPEHTKRAKRLRPIALQWGGHVFGSGDSRFQVALGTSLSTILRSLNVDVISSWNTGHAEYWGKVGHYKVAATACALADDVKKTPFGAFILANAGNIAFSDKQISRGEVDPTDDFVPLADVADIIWRDTRKKDSANHFADMDEQGEGEFKGKTLLELTKGGKNVDAATWVRFYQSIGTDIKHMGALPFRVWQMFDEAVTELRAGRAAGYLAAMGLMAHYVGDACQPLHVSRLHHGNGPKSESRVHEVYETGMIDDFSPALVQKVNDITLAALPTVNDGHAAAKAVIELMGRTFENLPPQHVLDVFNEKQGVQRKKHMWEELGDATAQSMADGARTLFMIWQSAWQMGNGDAIPAAKRGFIEQGALQTLYNDKKFVESDWLPNMVLAGAPEFADDMLPVAKKKSKAAPKRARSKRPARRTASR